MVCNSYQKSTKSTRGLLALLGLPLLLSLCLMEGSLQAQKVYWNGNGTKVQRANLDGSNVEDVIAGILPNPYSGNGLAIDEAGGMIYWSQPDFGVRRANLEILPGETASTRTDIELLYSFTGSVWDLAVDPIEGKLYFTTAGPGAGKVLRSNLDGSNLEELVTNVCCNQRGIDLDLASGKMYWVTGSPGRIQRANLEIPAGQTAATRTDIEVLISDFSNYELVSLALDVSAGKIYFTRPGWIGWPPIARKIQRANLDGSNVEVLITNLPDLPMGLALDVDGGKMYWGERDVVKRANLEIPAGEAPSARTDIEELVQGAGTGGFVTGVALGSGAAEVPIDIKPGSDPNSINCNNDKEAITVAILTTNDFDALTVDHATVILEGASETHVDRGPGLARSHEEDVDGDGDTDLVLHFRLKETSLTCESVEAVLEGETFDGTSFHGTDTVRMVRGTTVITVP